MLNSRNQFLPTALSVVSHNVALISGIVAAQRWPGLGILGPTLGVLGGAVLRRSLLAPPLPIRGAVNRPTMIKSNG